MDRAGGCGLSLRARGLWYDGAAVSQSTFHERLNAAIGHLAARHIGDRTGTNPEYVTRYLRGQPPPAEFIGAVCSEFDISGDWLLLGRGPMRASDAKHHALRETGAPDLLSALSVSVQRLLERVDRVERAVETGVLPPGTKGRAARVISDRLAVHFRAGGPPARGGPPAAGTQS